MYKKIKLNDTEIQDVINDELRRQKTHIELIASENYVSEDVLKATGSVLTNKYAEGYPGKRYYDGTKYVDKIETLAIDRLKQLFNVKHANVQPHSGSSANAAAIAALIKPGEKILGLSLDSGGHLTHGYKINFSGTFYETFTYEVDEDGFLDYEEIRKKAIESKPQLIIAGFSAYSRKVDFEKFRKIADEVGSKLMIDIAHIAGLIATGLYESPVDFADVITSTTHKTLRGARGGVIMTNKDDVAKAVDRWVFPGYQGGPLMHSIAGKAIAFKEALNPSFKEYQLNVIENAKTFAEEFIKKGIPVVSGGTDTHLFTINVFEGYGITGKEASTLLQEIGITVNKNTVPFDKKGPFVTSGIRLGTPAMTTRGFKKEQFIKLSEIMNSCLGKTKQVNKLHKDVLNLSLKFPL